MATPHVTGLCAYLLALDPTLDNDDLHFLLFDEPLIIPGKGRSMVRAWHAAMAIDELRSQTTLLKMLLDIDDGTEDGNLRVKVPPATTGVERSFKLVKGTDFEDDDSDRDGGIGNGHIGLGDFRRWRDWLLAEDTTPPATNGLNGSANSIKRDANRDGKVTPGSEG